ncbi:MAG: beta-ketoacyl-[acyl-carrier-protein] synthase family protein [Phycisphaerae bacterium]|nr:beta-ketoacyl-[acyl-carrier-protein] synthase family protein [Phycisphaerae bacterium]
MVDSPRENERRVVITGLGTVTPLGIGIEPLWDGLLAGQCGIKVVQAFDASGLASRLGGEATAFKMGDFVPKSYRKSIKVMARDIALAVIAAHEAVKDAGLKTKCLIERKEVDGPTNVDSTRFGANIGAGLICADLSELAGALASATDENGNFSLKKWGSDGMGNLTPLWLLKFLPNMLACHVTIVHDCQAHSNTVTCADAASHLAIGEAFRTIARGAADVCICGGAESKINPMGLARQQLLGRMATGMDDRPERACRPFGARRCGLVCSEGGGLAILEDLDHARARGARIYAEVVGFGAASNTHDWITPHPQGQGIAQAIRMALNDARVSPDEVELLQTFGVGTVEHDASEHQGLEAVFGRRCRDIPAIAVKGALGHNGAGSGALDVAVLAMSLYHNTVPPSLNTNTLDPEIELGFVTDGPVDSPARTGVTVGYALHGGQNAALVIRKYQE